jgi:hypothetical protein
MGGILASSPELMGATQRFQDGGVSTPRGVPDSPRLSESLQASAPIAMIGGKSFFLSEDGRFVVDAEGSVVRDPSVLSAVMQQVLPQPQAEEGFVPPSMGPTELNTPGVMEALSRPDAALESVAQEGFVPPSMGPTELNTPGVMAALDNAPRIQAEPAEMGPEFNEFGPEGLAARTAAAERDNQERMGILAARDAEADRMMGINDPVGSSINEFGPEGLAARTAAAERDNQERVGILAARDAEADRMMGVNDPVGSSMEDRSRMRIDEEDRVMTTPVPQPLSDIVLPMQDPEVVSEPQASTFAGVEDIGLDAREAALQNAGRMSAQEKMDLELFEVPQPVVEADASGGESTLSGNNFSSDPLYETPAGPEDPIKRDSKGVPTSVNPKRISDEKLQRFTDAYARSDRGPRAQEIYENQLAEYEAAVIQNDARQVYEDDIKAKKDAAAAVDTAAVVTSFNDEIEAAQAAGNTVLVKALQKQQAAAGADLTEIDGDADGSLGTDFTPSAKSTAVVEAPDQTEFGNLVAEIEEKPGDAGAIVSGSMLKNSGVDTSNMGIKERTVAMKKMLTDLMGQTDADEKEEFWMNMAMVGFGIASGDSPDAMKNIADGLLAGTAQISKGKSDKKARDDKFTLTAYGEVLADERAREKFARDLALQEARGADSIYGKRKDPLTQMYQLAETLYAGGTGEYDTYEDAKNAARTQVGQDYKMDLGGGDPVEIPVVTTKADFDKLPSGQNIKFKQNGKVRYKP